MEYLPTWTWKSDLKLAAKLALILLFSPLFLLTEWIKNGVKS